jgi:hypothetical protein
MSEIVRFGEARLTAVLGEVRVNGRWLIDPKSW